jgi:digeranylgeranylglycerophospholipid reductase
VTGLARFIDPDPVFISTEINDINVNVATGHSFTYRSAERLGYILSRPNFDNYLAEMAVSFGADLRTGVWASGITISENNPAVIDIQTGKSSATVMADYVIAADGVESMIGRKAGLKTLLELMQCESCLQYRITGIKINPNCMEFYVGKRFSPSGYLWVFPKSDHSANVGLSLNPNQGSNRDLRGYLDRFLKEKFAGFKIESEQCGMASKFIGFDILGRENLLLAGDAARTVDSLSGAGIAKGLHTGGLAARAIIAAQAEGMTCKALQRLYRSLIETELGKELGFYQKAYPLFRKFSDEDWESLVQFLEQYLKNRKAGSIDPATFLKLAIKGVPRLIRLARHLV